ncbi:MAG: sugar phosphate isomerase/epimerase [Clostridiales bacterium]|nr:sugar phosphate isomerase/epimerase [Clostridiales bacterium]
MKNFKVGIQLYSVREELAKDFEGTLKKVADAGYQYVEFAGFFKRSAEEIKGILEKYGLTAISVHQAMDGFNTPEKMQSFLHYAKTLTLKFVVIPWMNKEVFYDKDAYAQFVQSVKDAGEIFAKNGITLCYHNHDFEFEKIDGKYILDRLYEDVPEEFLKTQLDLCWVKYGGESPVNYIKKYAKRSGIIHFKDFYASKTKEQVYALIDEKGVAQGDDKKATDFKFMPLGQGLQNWEEIIRALEESDVEYVVYEKDQWYDGNPIEDARQSRAYLKNTFGL